MPLQQEIPPEILSQPIIGDFVDPLQIREEASAEFGDDFTHNEVEAYIDAETRERPQFIVDAAFRTLGEKQTKVGEIDAEIAGLESRIGDLATARMLLYGEPSEATDPGKTEQKQQSAYDVLVGGRQTAEEVVTRLLESEPFELVGLYDSSGRINLLDWLSKNRKMIGANFGKNGMSLFTRAVRTLSFTNVGPLVSGGAITVVQDSAETIINIAEPNKFFGRMLDPSVSSFGPKSGLVILRIAEMQSRETKERLTD